MSKVIGQRTQLALLILVSLVTIWGGSFYELERRQREYVHNAETATALQAQVFAENTLSSIKRINELLLDLRSNWAGDFDRFSETIKARQEYISDLTFQIGIIDATGYLAYTNLARVSDRTYLGDREHFQAHSVSKEDRLFISKPIKGKVSGKWTIQFTRPIYREGRFTGVIVASVSPDTFANFRTKLALSENAIITMARSTGEIMARSPGGEDYYGMVVSGIYSKPDAPAIGNFSRPSQSDGIERVFGYYKASTYPLTFFVAESMDYLLQPVRKYRIAVLFYASAISLLLIGFYFHWNRSALARERALTKLHQENEKNLALMRNASDGIHILDSEGLLIEANDVFLKMLGYSHSVVGHLHVGDWDAQDDWEVIRERNNVLLQSSEPSVFQTRHKRSDGKISDVEISACAIDIAGQRLIYASSRDISERKRTEDNLRLAASVFANSYDGVSITDANNKVIDINPAFTRITGYQRDEILGRNPKFLASGRQGPDFYIQMWDSLREHDFWQGEIWNRKKSGEVYAEMLSISVVRDNIGQVQHYIGVFSDISQVKAHEAELQRIAHYDTLTQLPNRRLLADRFSQAIARARRSGNPLAVCYLDLDGFKAINDQHGHAVGDRLLIDVAERLKGILRADDTVARLGGDEFVLLFTDVVPIEESHLVLDRILAAVSTPVLIDGMSISVSASIGVTLFPADDADADALLRHADQAMYLAKEAGKNRYHLFDPERDRQVQAHRTYLQRLREALGNGEFVLHYQPKVNLVTGAIIGAEALIRWQHPDRGLLPPAEFLRYLDGSDLEIAVGEWVLDTVLKQIAEWNNLGLNLTVSANISADHLLQIDFADRLGQALGRHPEVAAGNLELEILETAALANMDQAVHVLARCRQIGVHLSLDDFGTGYSSLTYFRTLPVDILKIDQSFVRDMLEDPDDLGIVESVIRLAHAFNRPVIAEGVETLEHGAMLVHLGCQLGQGYGIARPMPAELMPDWVDQWRRKEAWLTLDNRLNTREDVMLMVAAQRHRKWIDQIAEHLDHPNTELDASQDSAHCRFGHWYRGSGTARYGRFPEFQAIDPLHETVHVIAAGILGLARDGQVESARSRLPELYATSDGLLAQIEMLIQKLASHVKE